MARKIVDFDDARAVERAQKVIFVSVASELSSGHRMALRTFDDYGCAIGCAARPIDRRRATVVDGLTMLVARKLYRLQRHVPRSVMPVAGSARPVYRAG